MTTETLLPPPWRVPVSTPQVIRPRDARDFQALTGEALDHPERTNDILRIFFQQMEELIGYCLETQDKAATHILHAAAETLSMFREALEQGTDAHRATISKHSETIDLITSTAVECISSIFAASHREAELQAPPAKRTTSLQDQLLASIQQRNDEDALDYIAQGAPIHVLSQEDKDRLAALAMLRAKDASLAALIRGGCHIFNPSGLSPMLLDAVSSNLIESVKALIERHANLHTTDAQKNTALHRAFLLGNPAMVRVLLRCVDPQSTNVWKQTALQSLLNTHPDALPYRNIDDAHIPAFLETLFKQDLPEARTPAREMLFTITGGKVPPVPLDIVEMAFLLNHPDLNAALWKDIGTHSFLTACAHLEQRYHRDSVLQFMMMPFNIDPFHFGMGGESAPVPPLGTQNPPLKTFLKLFDNLNFYNPSAPHYVDASAWWRDSTTNREVLPREKAIKQLRGQLKTGIKNISNRVRFAGVPVVNTGQWFDRIDLLLKHILITLEKKNDPATTLSTLKELRSSFQHCATAYTTAAVNLYERLCFNIDPTQRDIAFLRALATHRRRCFDEALNLVHDREIHHGHKALIVLGPELGIQGHKEEAQYQDPGYRGDCRPAAVREAFYARYTPYSILDWLLQALKANTDSIRDPYIDLHKHFMPSNWQQDRYGPVLDQLQHLEEERDLTKRKTAIDELLAKHDIVMGYRQPQPRSQDLALARKAVEEDRFNEYLGAAVFDEQGKFRPQAAVYLLSCMHTIRSRLL